jgi:hypothetical protein
MRTFADDVRTGRFPSDAESYHLPDDVAAALFGSESDEIAGLYGGASKTA